MAIAKGRLKENILQSRNCSVHNAGDVKFKVDFCDLTKVVDFNANAYTYRDWDVTNIP